MKEMKILVTLLLCLLYTQALAAPTRPELGGTGCSNPATVADLADYAKDGALCQVQDGASSSDCSVGSGSNVVLCCYDGSAWAACGGGAGGGSGDVTGVGDCTGDECFNASGTGNSIMFEGSTADAYETTLTVIDPTADRTISLPNEDGTACTTGSVCPGYSSSAHTHIMGLDGTGTPLEATSWFTTTGGANGLVFEGTTSDTYEGTLSGADFTADRTLTLPDQTGTICVNDSTTSGCGNVTNSAATTDNALVAWTGTGGKTAENTECVMSDIDGDGSNDYISCPEGYTSGDQGCANNIDCNVFALAKNDGGGSPTCATMEAGNSNLLDKLFLLPKSDDSVVLCDGSTEIGTVASTSTGDVATIGDCTSGDCFSNAAGGGNSLIFEGATANDFEITLTAADATTPDKTITLPNLTGTVSVNPSGCTGTTQYADAAGNCDTLDGLEDFESNTNHGVPVADGSVFATKALADSDAPSTSTAGATLHYNTADQSFAAYTLPTVDSWYPYGAARTGVSTDGPTGASGDDICHCYKMPVTQAIADLDDMSTMLTTANTTTNDKIEVGVYSEDGATQYFECDFIDLADTPLSTGVDLNCKSGTTTGNGKILQPGDYWICWGADATSGTIGAVQYSAYNAASDTCNFSQACANGELPDTLTAPSCTFSAEKPPFVWFRNE